MGSEINALQKQIASKKKAKEDAEDVMLQKAQIQGQKQVKEKLAASKRDILQQKVRLVGNYVHSTVPVGIDEADNKIIRTWSPEGFDLNQKLPLPHHEVLRKLGGYDSERGVKLAGHRGYCLTDMGMFLQVYTQINTLGYPADSNQKPGFDQLRS